MNFSLSQAVVQHTIVSFRVQWDYTLCSVADRTAYENDTTYSNVHDIFIKPTVFLNPLLSLVLKCFAQVFKDSTEAEFLNICRFSTCFLLKSTLVIHNKELNDDTKSTPIQASSFLELFQDIEIMDKFVSKTSFKICYMTQKYPKYQINTSCKEKLR